jgi:hypothetical protein
VLPPRPRRAPDRAERGEVVTAQEHPRSGWKVESEISSASLSPTCPERRPWTGEDRNRDRLRGTSRGHFVTMGLTGSRTWAPEW